MSHRVTEEWMGERVETLEDLLRPGLRAICIGINPAPNTGPYESRTSSAQLTARR